MKEHFFYKNKTNFGFSIFFILLEACFNVYIAFVLMNLTDTASQKSLSRLYPLLVEVGVFVIGYFIVGTLKSRYKNRYIQKAVLNYKENCFERLLRSKYNVGFQGETGKFLSYYTNNIESIQKNYVECILDLVSNAFLMLLGLAAMIYLSISMSLCVIVFSLMPVLGSMLLSGRVAKAEANVSKANKRYVEIVKDVLSGYSVIKSFGAENETLHLISDGNHHLEDEKYRKRILNDLIEIVSGTLSNISIVMTFVLGAYLAITGKISVGTVIAFIQLINYVLSPIEKISTSMSELRAGKELLIIFDNEVSKEEENESGYNISDVEMIRLQNVGYSYGESQVLSDINCNFEKGKSYAIVGNSGSGKTTILNMIAGMLPDYKGNVLINDKEITSVDARCKCKLFSFIQQNVIVFNGSIKDNITLWKKSFSKEEIDEAITKSVMNDIVEEKGMDYLCGENGINLSGGEKQRMSIARAILQKSAVILIDEGTSSLDNESAAVIEDTLSSIKDKIVISVTHRLEEKNLAKYDEILTIKNGRIVEKGKYDDLVEKKGYFWALYNA
ncbi:MAG: ABC transporter ATP-binding protein/permease [Acetatifactor sp.]|nr:ABC transporter ATP-binding protein/permease [Acetatifactor sp.]